MALTKRNIKRVTVGLAAASTMAFAGINPAFAAEESAEASTDTTVAPTETTAAPTETTEAAAKGHALELDLTAGTTCVVTIRNQFSVHPDTDVEVTVGDKVYVLSDVEADPDKVTTSEPITVGDAGASVFVKYGPDGKSSLGEDNVSCEAPKPAPVVATPTYTG